MSARYLTCALFTEGRSDELLLAEILQRQLSSLVLESALADFERVHTEECRTIAAADCLDREVLAAATYTDIVILHNDHNEAGKIEALRGRIAAAVPDTTRLVGIVPRRETEAWALADPKVLQDVARIDRTRFPAHAAGVEKIADPKAELRAALGPLSMEDGFELIGKEIRLDRLAQVPAYQLFLQDLTTALKELNFQ